jgi:hypothetical protein
LGIHLGLATTIKNIEQFPIVFKFVATHTIEDVIHNDELKEFNTIEMVLAKIHGKSVKLFIYIYIYGDDVTSRNQPKCNHSIYDYM